MSRRPRSAGRRPGPRVCQLGNLVEVKNPLRLLEAFAELRREQPGAALALVGDGPLRGEIAARAGELGIADARDARGRGRRATRSPRWLRAAHVCALASLREGFGLAAVEALACGRPVARQHAPRAPRPLVREGVTGALLDPLDVSSITRAIGRAAALEPGAAAVDSVARVLARARDERLARMLAAVEASARA